MRSEPHNSGPHTRGSEQDGASESHGQISATPQAPASASREDESFHRLHWTSLFFNIARLARRLLIPAIIVLLFSRGDRWNLFFAVLFVPGVAVSVLQYLTLRYRLASGGMVVKEGLIFRNERHIRFERIQNVDLTQTPLQRLLKVAELRLETAGGAKPEAVLRVLSLHAVEDIRARVFAHRKNIASQLEATDGEASRHAADLDAPRLIHQLTASDLLALGFISNRGLVLVAIAMGVLWEFDVFDRFFSGETLERATTLLERLASPVAIVLAAVFVFVFMKMLSLIWMVLWFFGYRLERAGDDMRLSAGLLTKRFATIPRQRVQRITITQSPVQALMRRASISVATAGGGSGGSGEERNEATDLSRKWFVPIMPRDDAGRIIRELRPEVDLPSLEWRKPDRKAARRVYAKWIFFASIIVAVFTAALRPWGAMSAAIFIPLAIITAHRQVQYMRYAIAPWGVAFRSGAWTRRISAAFFDKMQTVSLLVTPFDRRHHHAALHVHTAGTAEHAVRIPYLRDTDAQHLMHDIYQRTQAAEFRW